MCSSDLALLTVETSWPDRPIDSLYVKSRPGPLTFAVLAVSTSAEPPVTAGMLADRRPGDWYDFRVPTILSAPLPIDPSLAVTGPASRRVVVRDGHLSYEGGPRARFWGVNLVGPGAVPDPSVAKDYALGIARAGFNLVRPHHIDGDTEGSVVNPRRGEPGEPLALPEALDRFDRFHAELAAAGVYTWAETWTLRSFRPEEGLLAPGGLRVGNKDVSHFEPEYLEAKKAWIRAVWDRVNPYTGLRYADDPSIAVFELANEDSLIVAWNGGNLEKIPGPHRDRLDQLWNAWLRTRYKTDAAITQAWKNNVRGGLQLGESLSLDSIAREPASRSRAELYPHARAADLLRFYGEIEAAYYGELARFVKQDLGFSAPLVCDTSFGVPLADAQLAACDVIDLHVYWDPIAESNVYFDHALVERPLHGRILERLSWCQADKPCTMSELNHSFPNRYAQEAPLFWASLLARQDFDAVIWFAWSHAAFEPAPDGPGGALDLAGRFSTWVQHPTASALFRSGVLPAPNRRFTRWWSPPALLRDLTEGSLWLDPQISTSGVLDNLLRTSFERLPPTAPVAPVSPSPVRWWPDAGRFVTDTPRFQAIVGRTVNPVLDSEQGSPDPGALRAALASYAAISLASLDGGALGDGCRRALLTLAGRTERDGTIRSIGGPGSLVYGRGPARLERLAGFVDVRWAGRPEAWVLDPQGAPVERVALARLGGGWWRLTTAALSTPWIELRSR